MLAGGGVKPGAADRVLEAVEIERGLAPAAAARPRRPLQCVREVDDRRQAVGCRKLADSRHGAGEVARAAPLAIAAQDGEPLAQLRAHQQCPVVIGLHVRAPAARQDHAPIWLAQR
jgi:hypothetical protein